MDESRAVAESAKEQEQRPEPRETPAPRLASSFLPLSSRDLTEWLLLVLLSCISVLPGLLPGRTLGHLPLSGDERAPAGWMDTPLRQESRHRHATQHVPWTQFAASRLAAGDVPLWNPYAQLGAPLLGNGRTAFFYPTILL